MKYKQWILILQKVLKLVLSLPYKVYLQKINKLILLNSENSLLPVQFVNVIWLWKGKMIIIMRCFYNPFWAISHVRFFLCCITNNHDVNSLIQCSPIFHGIPSRSQSEWQPAGVLTSSCSLNGWSSRQVPVVSWGHYLVAGSELCDRLGRTWEWSASRWANGNLFDYTMDPRPLLLLAGQSSVCRWS